MSNDEVLPEAVSANWDVVIEEATEQAEQYREDGWEAVVVHPGDVTAVFDDPLGLDVLASRTEFERVQSLAESHTFDRSHVYRRDGGVVFVLTVFEATADSVAVFVPTYVSKEDLDQLFDRARAADELPIHVRPLSDDARVTFVIDDPDLFFETE